MLNVGRIVRKQKVIQPPPSEISTRKSKCCIGSAMKQGECTSAACLRAFDTTT